MHGVRNIMSRIFYYAEGHGLWEKGKRSPASRAKFGRKRYVFERRILTFDETARVLARMEELNKLILETCIATGARISQVLGLQWKHVNLDARTVKIEQRVWHQHVGRPKTENSRRVFGIGYPVERFREKAAAEHARPEGWVFYQKWAPDRPMCDSAVRDALHQAARAEGCDFKGLGPHSFRRANITWRQEVGGSAIEASKIAGHSSLEMTSEYTFVAPERQGGRRKPFRGPADADGGVRAPPFRQAQGTDPGIRGGLTEDLDPSPHRRGAHSGGAGTQAGT